MTPCLFCSGNRDDPAHDLHCCGQQGEVEAREVEDDWTPTQSTGEAMALLERTRRETLARARAIALELIPLTGSTHTRAVFAAMQELGELPTGVRHHHWLGAVFRVKPFRWTGGWYVYTDPQQNIHERRIKTWTTDAKP